MRIALVGVGQWGKNLAKALQQRGVLSALVETSPDLKETLQRQYPEVPVVDSIESLLGMSIQGVAISTPGPTHYSLAKKCLEMDFDVFLEKPMTLKAKESLEIQELSEEKNKILMVGHLLVYQPAIHWVKNFLKENGVGKLLAVRQERIGFGKIRLTENSLWSLGVHDLAVLLFLLDQKPISCEAFAERFSQGEQEDSVWAFIRFPDVTAQLFTSWYSPFKSRKIMLIGSEGILTFDELTKKVFLQKKSLKDSLTVNSECPMEVVFEQEEEPLGIEMDHFLDCLRTRKKPLSDAEQGVRVVQVLEMISKKLERKNA